MVKGDGIGPEVVNAAAAVLEKTGKVFGHTFEFADVLAGGCAIDLKGEPLPEESINICKNSDAVLLGAVGGPKWDSLPGELRPEKALLGLRKALGLYANLRPAKLYPALRFHSPLRSDIARAGIDLIIVRELTGGIYYGERGRRESKTYKGEEAYDTERYSVEEIERIGLRAFELAMKRRKSLVTLIRPMCWKAQDYGVRPCTDWLRTSRRLNTRICWWTTLPCSLSAAPRSLML